MAHDTLSYLHGASDTPLMGVTVGALLDQTAARFPANQALVVPYQDVRWTYQELNRQSDEVAAGLLGLGLDPGDRIGIWAPNLAEWVVLQFATAKAGLILVNINPAYRLSELEFALNQVGARALVTVPSFKTNDYLSMLTELMPELPDAQRGGLQAARVPSLRWIITLGDPASGTIPYVDLKSAATPETHARLNDLRDELQFDDPINIQFTSGTTGRPKAATLTHHNIVNNARFTGLQMKLTERRPDVHSRCRCITASAWCWARWPAWPTAPPWSFSPRPASTPRRR